MKPLITIGIASYNYASYIIKGLDAIKRQKFTDYEILISDDCSTDNSVFVLKQYMAQNPQMPIRLIEKKRNEGLIANKNTLIENCNGLYLMLCDADDWMSDDCLEKIAKVILEEEPDRILVEVTHIDEKGKIIQIEHLPKNQSKWSWNIHHGCVNKVSILREHNIKIKGNPDDVYFTIEFSQYCKKISFIREPLYFWLIHLDSAGRKTVINLSEYEMRNIYGKVLYFIGEKISYIENNSSKFQKQDKEELRLVLLKMYYFRILFSFQKQTLKNKLKFYKILREIMRSIDKYYLDNKYLSQNSHAPLRKYAMDAIKLCVKLERLHLMPLAIVVYHFIGKFKYFDQ